MGLSTSEKAELATYKLNDVRQAWYIRWRNNRHLRGGPVTSEVFKKAFLDRFFLREKRDVKTGQVNQHLSKRFECA